MAAAADVNHANRAAPPERRRLTEAFYARGARRVARDLLGKRLVRVIDGQRVSGIIIETEAYCDADEPDLACHGSDNAGRPTARNAVMHGPPGRAYVYFTYGMHWMFNVVTGEAGRPNAVLVRAIRPEEGVSIIAANRAGRPPREWTNGPAKLCAALAIDGTHNGVSLIAPSADIWLEDGPPIPDARVTTGPRVGLGKRVPEPWLSMPWRYQVKGKGKSEK